MAKLIHLNGPPGIGKSTLSARYADDNPGTLNLDPDFLHRLIGGARDRETRPWRLVWPLALAMMATHLDGGRDVILPQYAADPDKITGFEELAYEHGADFREVVLLDDREASIARFGSRVEETDDPWIRHFHHIVDLDGGPVLLGTMYDNLQQVLRLRPNAIVVPSVLGAVRETYDRLTEVLG